MTNHTDTDRLDLIDTAVRHLDARRYAGETIFAYYAAETASVWIVDADDMADLGGRLERDEPDAYSLWCAETSAREVTVEQIARACAGATSVRALRDGAADAGDIDVVAVCDLMGDQLMAALAAAA